MTSLHANGGLLENPSIRNLGGRKFIAGTLANRTKDDPRVGLTFWFALDQVMMLTEYPDVETAQKAYREIDEQYKARKLSEQSLKTRIPIDTRHEGQC